MICEYVDGVVAGDEIEEEKPIFIKINDKVYLSHQVLDHDSLTKLSLLYNVSKRDIKAANDLEMD